MTDTTAQATTPETGDKAVIADLIDKAGFASEDALYAAANGADDKGMRRLAMQMWLMLNQAQDALRRANYALGRVQEAHNREVKNAGQGYRRDGTWIQQAALKYAEETTAAQTAIDQFLLLAGIYNSLVQDQADNGSFV